MLDGGKLTSQRVPTARNGAVPTHSPEPLAHLRTLLGACGHGAVLYRAGLPAPAARSGTPAKAGGSGPAAAPRPLPAFQLVPALRPFLLPRMARQGSPFPWPSTFLAAQPHIRAGESPIATSSWGTGSGDDTNNSATARDTGVLNYIVYWGSAAGVSNLSTAGA